MHITLRQALISLGALGMAGTLMTGAVGLRSAATLTAALEQSSEINKALLAATRADMHHDGVQAAVYRGLIAAQTDDPEGLKAARQDLQEGGAALISMLKQVQQTRIPATILQEIDQALPVAQSYVEAGHAIQTLATQDAMDARAKLPEFDNAFVKLEVALAKPGDDLLALGEALHQEGRTTEQAAWLQIVLGAVLGLLIIVVICWRIIGNVMLSVGRASAAAREVSVGNLRHRIVVEGYPELRQLLQHLNQMSDNLKQVIGEVKQAAEVVATGGEQVAHGNADLSGRTESQASSLEQTAAAMHQVSTSVQHSADQVAQASTLVTEAAQVAETGGAVVADVIHSMRRIDEASRKISDIIGVIDSIAFQTNILALNAAVEAARAGDAGRGFAVVASEVRALSQRTAQAAHEIKGLILASVSEVAQGSDLVNRAGGTMGEVVKSVSSVSRLMDDLSTALREQSDGVLQVNDAITSLDEVTQQNAALVEEGAAAASSLKDQSKRLVDSVAIFQLA